MAIRNQELIERLEKLEGTLRDLGDLQPNLQSLQEAVTLKQQAETALAEATSAKSKADELLSVAEKTSTDIKDLTTKATSVSKAAEDANDLLLKKLGVANAEVLARSFGDQAKLLGTSSKQWWKRLNIYSGLLFLAILGVVAWETYTTKNFGSTAFFLKIVVVSPIAYLAYSASKQHRIETNLRHQYCFKAAVASSLESYRQLLADNVPIDSATNEKVVASQDALNRFLEARIADIFREPIENVIRVEDDDAMDSLIIGYQGKMYRSLRKMLSLPIGKGD